MSTWQKSTQNPSQILIGEHYVIFLGQMTKFIKRLWNTYTYLIRTSFREIYTSEIKCHRKKFESQKKLDKHDQQRHVELMHRHK